MGTALTAKDEKLINENWKRLNALQQQSTDNCKQTISVARCYPMKNRVVDVLPFDNSRVELPTTKDDYINASHIRHLSTHSPTFIATQWPTANSTGVNDFWTMAWQEKVETIAVLIPTPPNNQDVYWPVKKEEPIKIKLGKTGGAACSGELEVTLQSVKNAEGSQRNDGSLWTERIFTLTNKTTNTSRVVIHLQIVESKGSSSTCLNMSDLARGCLSYYRQQRVMTHPVLVHCLEGAGRTAAFLLMAAAMSEIDVATQGTGSCDSLIPDMSKMAALMCEQRKGVLRERAHLKLALEGVLHHAKHILVNKGVLKREMTPAKQEPGHSSGLDQLITAGPAITSSMHHLSNVPSADLTSNPSVQGIPANVGLDPVSEMINSLQLSSDSMSAGSSNQKSPGKKKITKADFVQAAGGVGSIDDLTKKNEKSDDPLSQLDPLWSLKSK